MKAVYSTTLLLDARLRQAALRAHGIESALWNEFSAFYAIGLPTSVVPLVIAVGPADAERALDVLREELARPLPRPDETSELLRERIRRAGNLPILALQFFLLLNLGYVVAAYLVFLLLGQPPPPKETAPPEELPPESWTQVPCRCGRSLELPEGDEESLIECPWCGLAAGSPLQAEDAGPRRPRVRLAIGLVAGAILLSIMAIPPALRLTLRAFESGTELTYRVLFPEGFAGDREAATQATLEVLLFRARKARLKAEGSVEGPDRVAIRIGIESTAQLGDAKRLLGRHVGFGLHPAAPREIQERFNAGGHVPAGFKPWQTLEPSRDPEYAPWAGRIILLRDRSVLEGRHVREAEAEEIGFPQSSWVVSVELGPEGAMRFDEAAKVLYHQRPHGLIAIVLDGKIHSLPAIRAETFGGAIQITGIGGRDEARQLAALLSAGDLPFPVGRIENGKPIPGEPERESRYGPGK